MSKALLLLMSNMRTFTVAAAIVMKAKEPSTVLATHFAQKRKNKER